MTQSSPETEQDVERHPGPFSGPDAELARACAMAVLPFYGDDDAITHQRILKNGIWNDHVAVQAALAAIYNVRKAAGAAQSAQQWQPIDTAPRDGTEILGLFHRRYDESSPATVYGPWTVAFDGRKWRSSWDGQEVIEYMSDFGTEYKGPDIEPTHWQPPPTVSIPSTVCPVKTPRAPKVRTSHHRNKEEAARLQELVDQRYAVSDSSPDRKSQP